MESQSECLAYAADARTAADATNLQQVRDKHLTSARSWELMGTIAGKIATRREKRLSAAVEAEND